MQNPRNLLRRIPAALDRLAFSALCALAVLIPLRRHDRAALIAVLTFFAALLVLVALDRRRAAFAREVLYKETERAIRLEKLLLLPEDAIRTALDEPSLILLRSENPSVGEITEALRMRPRVLCVLSNPAPLKPLIETHAPGTRLIGADALLDAARISCTQKEIEDRLSAQRAARQKRRRFPIRLYGGAWRFLLLGTLLLVLSLLWKHKIYYRLLSCLSFGMSVISGTFGFQKQRRNLGFFLDKIDK